MHWKRTAAGRDSLIERGFRRLALSLQNGIRPIPDNNPTTKTMKSIVALIAISFSAMFLSSCGESMGNQNPSVKPGVARTAIGGNKSKD